MLNILRIIVSEQSFHTAFRVIKLLPALRKIDMINRVMFMVLLAWKKKLNKVSGMASEFV